MTQDTETMKLGRVYKLVSTESQDVYVGSTWGRLRQRLNGHKNDYKQYIEGRRKTRSTSFELIKFTDVRIEQIYEGTFKNSKELREMEGKFMLETENCINKKIAGRSHRDYYLANIEKHREKCREYNKTHKAEISANEAAYREAHKEEIAVKRAVRSECAICHGSYLATNKARHFKTKRHLQALTSKPSEVSE